MARKHELPLAHLLLLVHFVGSPTQLTLRSGALPALWFASLFDFGDQDEVTNPG